MLNASPRLKVNQSINFEGSVLSSSKGTGKCFVMHSRHRRWRENFSAARFFLQLAWQNGDDKKE